MNGRSMHRKTEIERSRACWWNLQLTVPIVASMNMMPQASKKADRSIVLAEQLRLEVIKIDWQCELDGSLIADFNPSQVVVAEHTQNQRAAVVLCPRRVRLSILFVEQTSWPLVFCTLANNTQLLIARACMQNGNRTANGNGTMPFRWNRI